MTIRLFQIVSDRFRSFQIVYTQIEMPKRLKPRMVAAQLYAQDKLAERGNVARRLHEAIRMADAKGELTGPERQRLACVSAAYKHATSSFEGVEALFKQTIIFHDR